MPNASVNPPIWTESLLNWFDQNKREMPWRGTKNAYFRWVSEIMLQQTRVDTVIDYYNRFMECYPGINDLAAAQEDDVLKLWEGLGYYSRARNLLKAARVIVDRHGGSFPRTEKEALSLPGIGPYSAAAVLSMSYDMPLPSVDGNVLRVYCRLKALEENVMSPATVKKVRDALSTEIPLNRPGDFNESLMELGAVICAPTNPNCSQCPVKSFCLAHREGLVDNLPVRIKKDKITRHHYLVYYLMNSEQNALLIRKNPSSGLLGGLWAFPMIEMSTVDPISEENAAERIRENWGITLIEPSHKGLLKHIFTHKRWSMDIFSAVTHTQAPEGYQWIPLSKISELAFPEVYQKVIRLVVSDAVQ
jgi:A/G-specific adenine glycosylase